jgi:malate synthase
MEDAATAEISRTQIWQWIKHRASLEDGRTVTRPLVQQLIAEESSASLPAARALFEAVATSDELTDFLTLPAYEILVEMLDGKTHSAKALAERRPS